MSPAAFSVSSTLDPEPTLQPNTKPEIEQGLAIYQTKDTFSCSSSLVILVDSEELNTPVSTPSISSSPSVRIDDAMSEVSVLSPSTPFMSPTSDTSRQISIRDYDSPTSLSPCTSALSLEPFTRGTMLRLPPGLLSPVDAIRQQDVSSLPSPMARDLRRRVEADNEDAEMDITAACEDDNHGSSFMGESDTNSGFYLSQETSCLGLDLGLPVNKKDDPSSPRSYVFPERCFRNENMAPTSKRKKGIEKLDAKVMQATMARSTNAELVSSPEKPRVGRTIPALEPTHAVENGHTIPKKHPRRCIPLPQTPERRDCDAYTLPTLPLDSTPDYFTPRSGSHKPNPGFLSFGRALGPSSPSLKRIHDIQATDLTRLRMHGRALFPKHFPEGFLLEANFARQYSLETELGAGGYGFVLGARSVITGEEVAVKFIDRSSISARGLVKDHNNDIVPLEAVVLQLAQHPGVVKFHGLYKDDLYFYLVQELHGSPWSKNAKNQYKPELNTPEPKTQGNVARSKPSSPLSPYAPAQSSPLRQLAPSMSMPAIPTLGRMPQREGEPHGLLPLLGRPQMPRRASYDLFECIEQHERLSENQAKYIFAQVVDTVRYLESIGITHRDIKDENLVIDQDFKVKVIDFGSAVVRDLRKSPPKYTNFYGTLTFASPEILNNLPYTAPPAEVWTLGILLSFLVTGQSPFPTPEHAMRGLMCQPSASVSPACGDLMKKCFHPDPARRLTVRQIQEHPWLRGALDRA